MPWYSKMLSAIFKPAGKGRATRQHYATLSTILMKKKINTLVGEMWAQQTVKMQHNLSIFPQHEVTELKRSKMCVNEVK